MSPWGDNRGELPIIQKDITNIKNYSYIELTLLRHDVDKLPENSLVFAKTQAEMGIKGSYYFVQYPKIIEKIASLGHEIGYHYEDVDLAANIILN